MYPAYSMDAFVSGERPGDQCKGIPPKGGGIPVVFGALILLERFRFKFEQTGLLRYDRNDGISPSVVARSEATKQSRNVAI